MLTHPCAILIQASYIWIPNENNFNYSDSIVDNAKGRGPAVNVYNCGILSFLEPLYVNVTKQVFVLSVLECAHLCRAEETCEAFKHRNVHDDVNCQITEGEPEVSTLQENDGKAKWTLYTLETIESVRNYQIGNSRPMKRWPYWTPRKNSLELI